MANQGAADNRSLHELAIDIVQDIHLLSTGLAHAGAPPNVTEQIDGTSNLYAGIAKALAGGPLGGQPVGEQPGGQGAAPGGASAPAPQASASPAAPQPQAAARPNPIGGNSPQGAAYGDLHNTIAQMHRDSVNAVSRSAR